MHAKFRPNQMMIFYASVKMFLHYSSTHGQILIKINLSVLFDVLHATVTFWINTFEFY